MKKNFLALSAFALASLQIGYADSGADPFNQDITLPINVPSFNASAESADVLTEFSAIIQSLNPSVTGRIEIDPSKLSLVDGRNIFTYFLAETSENKNMLVVSYPNYSTMYGQLNFSNTSTNIGEQGDGSGTRSEQAPLLPGDFVSYLIPSKDLEFDFFLIAKQMDGNNALLSASGERNRDGMRHARIFADQGSTYLLIGFEEELGGGDGDFNDLVIAVDVGGDNIRYLIKNARLNAPEPTMALGGLVAGAVFMGSSRRRRMH